MTVVLCYSCDQYSILAADTRGISFNGDKDDTCKKLLEHNYGWLANMGASLLSHPLMNLINEADLNANILDLFMESYNRLIQVWDDQREIQMFQKSIVAVSWIGNKITILKYIQEPEIKAVITDIEVNRIFILYPPEYFNSPDKVYSLAERNNDFYFSGDIRKCLIQICKIFKEIASNSDSVSNICEVGILIGSEGKKVTVKDDVDKILLALDK